MHILWGFRGYLIGVLSIGESYYLVSYFRKPPYVERQRGREREREREGESETPLPGALNPNTRHRSLPWGIHVFHGGGGIEDVGTCLQHLTAGHGMRHFQIRSLGFRVYRV